MAKLHAVHMSDVMREITVQISLKGVRSTRIRLWIGARLIALAGRIMGCNVEVEN